MLLARNDALAMAGFSVSSPREPAEAVHILVSSDVDVIVLGHSIPKAERAELSRRFREIRSEVPIIVMYEDKPEDDERTDAFVGISEGPEVLIAAIQSCLKAADERRRPA